jgi:hypothetical protein
MILMQQKSDCLDDKILDNSTANFASESFAKEKCPKRPSIEKLMICCDHSQQ